MEFVCCLLGVGSGIWLLVWLYESGREKKRAEDAERIERAVAGPERQFPMPQLEPWPVCESVRHARDWLAAVADVTRAADRSGTPVRLAAVEACLEDGWRITAAITGKIDALRHTRGEDWLALPPETRAHLRDDDERLRRLSHLLASLRDDLTNAIAASGWGRAHHVDVIADDLRAVDAVLRDFPADPAQEA